MASWDTQRWYLPLLERTVTLPAEARVLEMGYYDPAGALWAAQHARHVVALRPAIDLVADLERGAREAGAANVEVRLATRLEPAEAGAFHAAFLLAPFFLGNAPVRAAIHTVTRALRPDGALYLQVHRRHGGATFLRYCEAVFDQVEALGIGGGQRRLYRASGPRAEAVPVDEPAAAAEAVQEVTLRGVSLRLRFAAGVFGARTVDPAARLLVEQAPLRPGVRILDLGCGAGTIGLALAAAGPTARVVLSDASQPAVDLSTENAARNHLANAQVRLGDGYDAVAGERFDLIVSNLPAHRGHESDLATAERFIAGAPAHLRDGGEAWFVAHKALPYELPASRAFRQVQTAATDARYKVLQCAGPRTGASGRR